MKLLHWERGGFVIYYKRMESGRVSHKIFLKEGTGFRTIRWDELVLFMEGISVKIKRRIAVELLDEVRTGAYVAETAKTDLKQRLKTLEV